MPTLTEDQRHAILVYLNIEGFRAGAMTALDNDIVDLLNDNGYTVPTYKTGPGAGNPMLGGNKQYSKHVGNHFKDSNIQSWMGLANEGEADNYTRHIVTPGAGTGSSRSAKRNSAGDPLPARVLKPEHFDHNGMMARNILSIASIGTPDAAWIAAAKKVAAGANYLSEFPANLGDTYALGSRGVHPTMGSTTPTPTPPPAPAVTPTPTPAPTPAPAPVTPVVEEEEIEETPEETVVEETVQTKAPVGTTYLGNENALAMNQPTSDPRPSGRSLNDATWAARDASMGGMYPYDTSRAPLKIVFSQHPSNANLQPPVTAKNVVLDLFGDSEDVSITEVDASPDMFIIIVDGNAFVSVGGQQYVFDGIDDTPLDVRVAWKRGSDEITGLVVKDGSKELIRISDRKLMLLDTQSYQDEDVAGDSEDGGKTILAYNDAPSNFWVAPEVLYDVSEVDPLKVVYAGPERSQTYGIGSPSSARDDYNQSLNELRDNGFGFGYFSPENVQIMGSLSVYETGLKDTTGDLREENYWLSRVVADTTDQVDVSQTYIAVNLVFDMDTSTTTDLFNGGPELVKMETLIFPGDEADLDPLMTPFADGKSVVGELDIDSEGLRALMLKDINTSAPTPAVDEDGNALGYDDVSDVTLLFHNMATGTEAKISIPNPDDEFAAIDMLGQTLRGRVESIELRGGDPAAAYQKQKAIRRQQRMSDAFNIRNGSKSDENATAAVAFSKGSKYYIVGRHNGRPVLVEMLLDF